VMEQRSFIDSIKGAATPVGAVGGGTWIVYLINELKKAKAANGTGEPPTGTTT